MKFVDQISIQIKAGGGGPGCLSFLRARNLARGGPNGGDGGHGGSVFLTAADALNTLVDYNHKQKFSAQNGEPGQGNNRSGAAGEDLVLKVPVGTLVYDENTGELISDLSQSGQTCLVAQGGKCGLGNARFKSSINRAPRKTTKGDTGELRSLDLQLRLAADVGLLGLPNAGKSMLISKVSAARPKVADYPFTTKVPNLGTVQIGTGNSFVIADVPGLIEGAADGQGLGLQFLAHLTRTRLLLHMVDIADQQVAPEEQFVIIAREIKLYSEELAQYERWLVVNKIDMLPQEQVDELTRHLCEQVNWQGRVFQVSALSGAGLESLVKQLAQYLQEHPRTPVLNTSGDKDWFATPQAHDDYQPATDSESGA